MIEQEWTILDEQGQTALTLDSFLDLDARNEGKALSYPVEEGAFANYNKVQNPSDIRVTLARQGTDADFEYVLAKLEEYQQQAVKLAVVTPADVRESTTLESYSYKRTRDAGARMLIVELHFVEVKEVKMQTTTTTITKPKNATSSSKVNTGKTQTQTENADASQNQSLLSSILSNG